MKCFLLLTVLFVGATFAVHHRGDGHDHKGKGHKHEHANHYCYRNDAQMIAMYTYEMVQGVAEATKSLLKAEAEALEGAIKSDGYKTKDPGPGPFDSAKEGALEVQENEDLKAVMQSSNKCVVEAVFEKRQKCCEEESACGLNEEFTDTIDECLEKTNNHLDEHYNRIFTKYVTEVERVCTGADARIDSESMTVDDQIRAEGDWQKNEAIAAIIAQTKLILENTKEMNSCEDNAHHEKELKAAKKFVSELKAAKKFVSELKAAKKFVSKPFSRKLRKEQRQAIKSVQEVEETMHAESKHLRELVTKE